MTSPFAPFGVQATHTTVTGWILHELADRVIAVGAGVGITFYIRCMKSILQMLCYILSKISLIGRSSLAVGDQNGGR